MTCDPAFGRGDVGIEGDRFDVISLMNDCIGNDDQDTRWPVYLRSARSSRDNSAQGWNHQAIERSMVEAVVCGFASAHARCVVEALQQTSLVKVEHLLL